MWPHSDTESETDSDSDRSYASGDPRKYPWLRSTYEQGQSSRRRRRHDDDSDSETLDPEDVKEDNALWAYAKDEMKELREKIRGLLAQDAVRENALDAANYQLQEARDHNASLTNSLDASEARNEHLVKRVAELCSFMCGRWVDHASDQLRAQRLSCLVRLLGWIILGMLVIILPLVARP